MTIEDAIQAMLIADTGVTALVSTRVRVPGNQQSVPRPYIVHFQVAVDPINTHDGEAALLPCLYQVSCFSGSPKEARSVAKAVRNAITGMHSVGSPVEGTFRSDWTGQRQDFDPDAGDGGTHQVTLEFDIFSNDLS